MPIIDSSTSNPSLAAMASWRPLHRIENTGGGIDVVNQAVHQYAFERLLYAEGDSWFDKFTPIPMDGTNLLAQMRLPCFAGVVDVSHIGDTSERMVNGRQREQTETMFDLHDFHAILLSAGGNDLKNLFATLYEDLGNQRAGREVTSHPSLLKKLVESKPVDEFFDGVIADIQKFIALRDASQRKTTRNAPLFLHGYDHLQPRPAPGTIFAGTGLGAGPWLYPSLKHAGLTDAQMLAAATAVVDELNVRLRALVAAAPANANLWLMDQRGLLTLAAPGSTAESGDWLDEIHATPAGHTKLVQARWNPALAKALNLL